MKHPLVYLFVGVLLGIVATIIVLQGKQVEGPKLPEQKLPGQVDTNGSKLKIITSFDECVAAGYEVLQSYPGMCKTPDGRTFIQEISPQEKEGLVLPTEIPRVGL